MQAVGPNELQCPLCAIVLDGWSDGQRRDERAEAEPPVPIDIERPASARRRQRPDVVTRKIPRPIAVGAIPVRELDIRAMQPLLDPWPPLSDGVQEIRLA